MIEMKNAWRTSTCDVLKARTIDDVLSNVNYCREFSFSCSNWNWNELVVDDDDDVVVVVVVVVVDDDDDYWIVYFDVADSLVDSHRKSSTTSSWHVDPFLRLTRYVSFESNSNRIDTVRDRQTPNDRAHHMCNTPLLDAVAAAAVVVVVVVVVAVEGVGGDDDGFDVVVADQRMFVMIVVHVDEMMKQHHFDKTCSNRTLDDVDVGNANDE
jgi:hypothetical protein